MPDKIITDQPQARRRTIQRVVTGAYATIAEAPYFSIPEVNLDVAVADPDDDQRELRPGEVFFATALMLANTSASAVTVDIEINGEGGVTTMISPGLTVPANDVLALLPGLSLFKRDLDNPTATADRLRIRASTTGVLHITASVVEREALEHSPDTESV